MLFEEKKYDLTDGRECSLFGAFPSSHTVRFRLEADGEIHAAKMEIHNDGYNRSSVFLAFDLSPCENAFELTLSFTDLLAKTNLSGEGLYYYHYKVITHDGEIILGGERPTALDQLDGYRGERQLLLYRDDYRSSSSFTNGPVYHVFVDRFYKSGKSSVKPYALIDDDWENGTPVYGAYPGAPIDNNVFFGGDLWGVIEKLDYIAALGTGTIYLSPVFEAHSNHKYDTGDYLKVDEMFGGDDALFTLCREAKKRGIDVILDGVFNHTGDDSVYFNRKGNYSSCGAYQSKESPFYEWYNFRSFPEQYECWWGVEILPRVKSANEEYRRFICGNVVAKWMDGGVAGWRLDVADELADSFLDDFRAAMKKKNPDGVLIGEVWEDASDKVSYGVRRRYFGGAQLDSVMNYPLRNGLIAYLLWGECDILRQATEGLYRRYPKPASDNLLNFLGTHDTERILTLLGGVDAGEKTNAELAVTFMTPEERAQAKAKLKLAFAILCGLPGVPCVFYGDEAGLEGYRDPFCRRPFPWNRIDEDLLVHYRVYGNLRRNSTVFRDGLFRLTEITPEHIIYVREPWNPEKNEKAITVIGVREGAFHAHFSKPHRNLATGETAAEFALHAGECGYFCEE